MEGQLAWGHCKLSVEDFTSLEALGLRRRLIASGCCCPGTEPFNVLTAIWEPEKISYESRVEGNEVEGCDFIHVYNGLKWADVINFKSLSVSYKLNNADLSKNSEEWRQRST